MVVAQKVEDPPITNFNNWVLKLLALDIFVQMEVVLKSIHMQLVSGIKKVF